MALLASPDVGIRGRALLRTGIVANMTASTVAQCLAAIPADRRAALSAVRKAINENLPDGYEEGGHRNHRNIRDVVLHRCQQERHRKR